MLLLSEQITYATKPAVCGLPASSSFHIELITLIGTGVLACQLPLLHCNTVTVTVHCWEIQWQIYSHYLLLRSYWKYFIRHSQVIDLRAKVAGTPRSKIHQLPPSCCSVNTVMLVTVLEIWLNFGCERRYFQLHAQLDDWTPSLQEIFLNRAQNRRFIHTTVQWLLPSYMGICVSKFRVFIFFLSFITMHYWACHIHMPGVKYCGVH